jgi:GNAT superfamily N-acetyltransferase
MLLERLQRPVRGVRIIIKNERPFGAQIVPFRRLSVSEVNRVLRRLGDVKGPIVTSAMTPIERDGFLEAGFVEREALHLLRHSLHSAPQATGSARLRAGRRGDLTAVLEIDRHSFDHFWRLDRESFNSARRATPTNRYRVATIDRRVVGYAITGRSGRSSFLQRLGVESAERGKGIGTQLVADSIDWARGERASSMLVNTQVTNETARRLYESLGFVLDREQLKVLEWPR